VQTLLPQSSRWHTLPPPHDGEAATKVASNNGDADVRITPHDIMSVVDHWERMVRGWRLLGPPLRPSPADLAFVAPRIAGARRGVVLGVTPELVELPWPGRIVAVERDRAMIGALYKRATGAVLGDWRALPLATAAFDVAVGDGCLTVLTELADYGRFAAELARVLAPAGRAILRAFVAPEPREPLAAIATDPSKSFHALKWRIAMALGERVAVAAIKATFDALFPDRDALAASTGWNPEVIAGIDMYAGSTVYTFPTLATAVAALAPLELVQTLVPDYELGDRCITLVLRRSG
jgi:SAM-dependent methyltransferase